MGRHKNFNVFEPMPKGLTKDEQSRFIKQRIEASKKETEAAKEILNEQIKLGKVTRISSFKQKRTGSILPRDTKAAMMADIVRNPELSSQEFKEKYGYTSTGGAYKMMAKLKQEMRGLDLPEMEDILRADLVTIALAQKELLRRLDEEPDSMSAADINNISNNAFKRARLLEGKNDNAIKIQVEQVKDLKEEDLDNLLSSMVTVREIKR